MAQQVGNVDVLPDILAIGMEMLSINPKATCRFFPNAKLLGMSCLSDALGKRRAVWMLMPAEERGKCRRDINVA